MIDHCLSFDIAHAHLIRYMLTLVRMSLENRQFIYWSFPRQRCVLIRLVSFVLRGPRPSILGVLWWLLVAVPFAPPPPGLGHLGSIPSVAFCTETYESTAQRLSKGSCSLHVWSSGWWPVAYPAFSVQQRCQCSPRIDACTNMAVVGS